jgi:hypothetical protein
MKKVLKMDRSAFLAMAGIASAANYGVFVGLNKYNSQLHRLGQLAGRLRAGRDAHVHERDAARRLDGGELAGPDERAGHARRRIRLAISNSRRRRSRATSSCISTPATAATTTAVQSVYLCAYDDDYDDTLLAQDLAKFATGVKVIVMVDACHSGGLVPVPLPRERACLAAAAPGSFDLGASVTRIMEADRAAKLARGVKDVDKLISPSEIGWVTAATTTSIRGMAPRAGCSRTS